VAEPSKGTSRRQPPRASGPKAASSPPPDPVEQTVAAIRQEHPSCDVAFCPICLMVTAIGDIRPELVEHLLLAGRELLLAARSVIDARLETMDKEEKEGGGGLQRIRID
jgi:hypothetical protein